MVDMPFLVFFLNRILVSTTGLESFSLRPEKFPKRFSFGGGRVRFFLLCTCCRRLGEVWEKNLQGLKSWAWLPKLCTTFGALQIQCRT